MSLSNLKDMGARGASTSAARSEPTRRLETDANQPFAETRGATRSFAKRLRNGTIIYADGRFYLCVGRLGFGGGGDDVIVFASVPLTDTAKSTLARCNAAELDELARQGRVAIVDRGGPPRPHPTCVPRQPLPDPTPLAVTTTV